MVVHLKDQAHSTPLELLKTLLENAKNDALTHMHYLPSMLTRSYGAHKYLDHYGQQGQADKQTDGYTVSPAQVKPEPNAEALPEIEEEEDDLSEKWYEDGFHMGLTQAANLTEVHFGKCINCSQE